MDVFVSYSSKDRERVRDLVRDLEEVGYSVWFDQELTGGQDWWDRILHQIQSCDVFLIALSENWVMSGPCAQECGYALALNRHVLPVSIETLSPETLPAALQRLQIVSYHTPDLPTLKKLLLAINQFPPGAPLPDPLPAPPAVPISPLALLADRLQAAMLTTEDQRDILTRLRLSLEETPADREPLVLLERLIKHPACGDDLVSEAQALYAAFQQRAAAPPAGKYPRLTPHNAPQIVRLKNLSYFVLGTVTGGVFVYCSAMTFSSDGQLLAASYHETHDPPGSIFRAPLDTLFGAPPTRYLGTLVLYDTETRETLAQFKRQDEGAANHLSFSPDRRLLAAAYRDEVCLWDITLRRITRTLPLPEGAYYAQALAFSPDGGLLAVQFPGEQDDARLIVWDTQTWEQRADFELSTIKAVKDGLERPAFYFWPDSHRLLMLVKGEIHEANLRTFKTQRFAHSPRTPLQGLSPAAPGGWPVLHTVETPERLLICQPDPWQVRGQFVLDIEGVVTEAGPIPMSNFLTRNNTVERGVKDLAISPGGDLLAILTDKATKMRSTNTIALWDPTRLPREAPGAILTTRLNVRGLAFSPDGGLLAINCWDKQVELWGVGPEAAEQ